MERAVDFNRNRCMLCGNCERVWTVDLAWIERWNDRNEACPGCGTTCEAERAARVTVFEDDPALGDGTATQIGWYHTSTHDDWPPPTIDFAAALSDQVRLMMGGDEAVERWANRQSTKALHIGTYESAIHNMLRRICDQGDRGEQFYLYRVVLKPGVVIDPGWVTDPGGLIGDVDLEELCPAAVEAVRYVNYHEDPGGLTLAIRRSAIGTTQRLAIPLATEENGPWIADTAARISTATPDRPLPPELEKSRHLLAKSPRAEVAAAAASVLANLLPINLRYQFESATSWQSDNEPTDWARHTFGLAALIEDPASVLIEVNAQAACER